MNYRESVEYLYSLGNEVLAMKLGLDNIQKVLTAVGDPQKKYQKIQVAGTNGKGSTCAFLESICLQAGIKTGLFTSPHLINISERIRIDGEDIKDKDFARHATRVREESEMLFSKGEIESIPTFFEQVTAIGLVAFAEAGVHLAILETGMGGRFDAVTAAGAEIAAITQIDLDHQKILGDTLAEIAAEKAAIIQPGSRVVFLSQSREANGAIDGRCREMGVEPVWATTDISIRVADPDFPVYTTSYSFKTRKDNYSKVVLGLTGKHQAQNAAVAIGLAEELTELGFNISNMAICLGLETAQHKGRLEYYSGILFDGAHNVAGAAALADYLDEFVGRPVTLIFGAMRDKDVTEIIETLLPHAEKLIFTVADNPRSMRRDEFKRCLPSDIDEEKLYFTDDAAEAITLAKQLTSDEGLICVTGSLYLVGEVQKLLTLAV